MDNTTHQFTYTQDKDIIKKAVQRYWLRSYTPRKIIVDASLIAFFIYLLTTGERDWGIGMQGTFLAVVIFIRFATYFISLKQSMKKYDQMTSKQVTMTLNEECISVKSDLGYSEFPWKFIDKVWKFPEVWIIFLTGHQPISFPFSALDGDTQEFILIHAMANGGKVV